MEVWSLKNIKAAGSANFCPYFIHTEFLVKVFVHIIFDLLLTFSNENNKCIMNNP